MLKSYLEWVAIRGEVFSQNVQHPDHLGKYQDSVASFSESGQQLVQQHQLPTAPHDTLNKAHRLSVRKNEESLSLDWGLVSFAEERYPEVLLGAKEGSHCRHTCRCSCWVSPSTSSGCLMRKLWLQHFLSSITMFRKPEELPRGPL